MSRNPKVPQYVLSPLRAPQILAHPTLLELITRVQILTIFVTNIYPTSSLTVPNTPRSTSFSNNLNLCSSLRVTKYNQKKESRKSALCIRYIAKIKWIKQFFKRKYYITRPPFLSSFLFIFFFLQIAELRRYSKLHYIISNITVNLFSSHHLHEGIYNYIPGTNPIS